MNHELSADTLCVYRIVRVVFLRRCDPVKSSFGRGSGNVRKRKGGSRRGEEGEGGGVGGRGGGGWGGGGGEEGGVGGGGGGGGGRRGGWGGVASIGRGTVSEGGGASLGAS